MTNKQDEKSKKNLHPQLEERAPWAVGEEGWPAVTLYGKKYNDMPPQSIVREAYWEVTRQDKAQKVLMST